VNVPPYCGVCAAGVLELVVVVFVVVTVVVWVVVLVTTGVLVVVVVVVVVVLDVLVPQDANTMEATSKTLSPNHRVAFFISLSFFIFAALILSNFHLSLRY
jgi:hypothetical protein